MYRLHLGGNCLLKPAKALAACYVIRSFAKREIYQPLCHWLQGKYFELAGPSHMADRAQYNYRAWYWLCPATWVTGLDMMTVHGMADTGRYYYCGWTGCAQPHG